MSGLFNVVESDRLSVLMICPQFSPIVGGYERAAERLSIALAKRGVAVTVIAERRKTTWPADETRDGYKLRRLWCIYRPKLHVLTTLVSFFSYLLMFGRRFDVWHVHQYGLHAALAVALGRLLNRPVVLKLTSSGDMGLAQAIAKGRFPRLTRALVGRVAAIVALSRETVAEAEKFGIPAENISLLGNGVDTSVFRRRSEQERQGTRAEFGLTDRYVVIFVGRLSPEKNPDGLIAAWRAARPSLPASWLLVLLGDGPMRSELDVLIDEHELRGSVSIVGHRSDVDRWLGIADLYVSPSHREGLSNTLLEAMASELPVVSTRVSGANELVGETGAGVLVDVDDIEGLASALKKVANGDCPIRDMGEKARSTIEHDYAIEVVAARHEHLYEKLIGAAAG